MTPFRALPVALALLAAVPGAAAARDFPRDFHWGTAIAGLQSEAGGQPSNADRRSDWWVWSRDPLNIERGWVTGDAIDRGPGHWRLFRRDIGLAAERLRSTAFRFSIEWSRVFPRSTAGVRVGSHIDFRDLRRLDRVANRSAVRHYARVLRASRGRGLEPFVTVSHFSLPTWIHDPIAARDALAGRGPDDALPRIRRGGWLDKATVREFRKYAAYLAWKFGRRVTYWTPLNEPMVVAANGYVNVPGAFAGYFPPGAFSFSAAIRVVTNLVRANAAAYDEIHLFDREARVGPVHNMIGFTPADSDSAADRRAAGHADYVFNRLFLNAVVRGREDLNVDGRISRSERHPGRAGKADYIGLNYYFRSRVTALGDSISDRIKLLDFLPTNSYSTPLSPGLSPCPTTCTDFGWEIYPEGFRSSLATAGRYGLPVFVTENGLADADDDLRAGYLVSHLRAVRAAMRSGQARVRGYLYWTLVDNFEWAAGYYPRFGFFSYDPDTLRRAERPSARLFARIARTGNLP
ncbi:MAG TPA: glycoside hydrolase family 1 protein [Thermoleophilaceae bacterium]|nr:glycoside hydrolase family 1 protein [Thermoleophilaceae bacterium]